MRLTYNLDEVAEAKAFARKLFHQLNRLKNQYQEIRDHYRCTNPDIDFCEMKGASELFLKIQITENEWNYWNKVAQDMNATWIEEWEERI
jgi:hypothetical protein